MRDSTADSLDYRELAGRRVHKDTCGLAEKETSWEKHVIHDRAEEVNVRAAKVTAASDSLLLWNIVQAATFPS